MSAPKGSRRLSKSRAAAPAALKKKRKAAVGQFVFGALHVKEFFPAGKPVKVAVAAGKLGITGPQLLEAAGIKRAKGSSPFATARLDQHGENRVHEMLEIVSRISDWAGGKKQALAWYRAAPLPAFGGRTAEALVKEGKAPAVRDFLDQIALGGFA
jgi:Protein of unknown function (DUF2384)